MPLAKFVPFRAADVNLAWLRGERFWPCPPVPTKRYDQFDYPLEPVAEQLRKDCVCAEPLREGDILAPCPVHGWVTH